MASFTPFHNHVALPYQLYNSLFLTLPFETIYETGTLLPLLSRACETGYEKKQSPAEILKRFKKEHAAHLEEEEFHGLLFQFVQYIERQVVLFDALEDAAFARLNDLDGEGTIPALKDKAEFRQKLNELPAQLRDFRLRIVLTAHPTQFYPGPVLGIITDLDEAIQQSDLPVINRLLMQLGKTPFIKAEKPTPLDEATSLIWYLENVFYHTVPYVLGRMAEAISTPQHPVNPADLADTVQMGFWPGGDRDGNPFVNSAITVQVAVQLRQAVLRSYRADIRSLRRRLTFKHVEPRVAAVEQRLLKTIRAEKDAYRDSSELLTELDQVRAILLAEHQGLFLDRLDDFRTRVRAFGFHFAALDIRQDSRIHGRVMEALHSRSTKDKISYAKLSPGERLSFLEQYRGSFQPAELMDPVERDVLEALRDLRQIHKANGEAACHRYIISNCRGANNVLEVLAMARAVGWKAPIPLDVVPLFETVDDLQAAPEAMQSLYSNKTYGKHLGERGMRQTIMLGFSDGTKDGGYLMANWSIFRAKEELTRISREHGIAVVFFDGRGGPPSRGGGNTHRFYASLGNRIESREIQLTVQGQTISSNFGTLRSASFNLEQLLSAGIEQNLYSPEKESLSEPQRALLHDLAERSFQYYQAFKLDPLFLPYLRDVGPLEYYGQTNIGSRPSRRSKSGELKFEDLRAIPFVGTWSQLKQNVPGFYGIGHAMEHYEQAGRLDEVTALYRESAFFRALADNSMMALSKCFFPLTRHLAKHPVYGDFWKGIHREFEASRRLLLAVSGLPELMANTPANQASVRLRERIVLPLLTIQQYALERLREERDVLIPAQEKAFRQLVLRSMYGIINAGRNSA